MIVRRLSAAVLGMCLGASLPASSIGQEGSAAQEPRPLPLAGLGLAAPTANQRMADAIAAQLRQSGQIRNYHVDISYRAGVAELTGWVANAWQHAEVLRLVRSVPGVQDIQDRLEVGPGSALVPVQAAAPTLPMPAPGQPREPTPIFQAPPGPNPNLQPPPLPPNAWPTFAPYNNYSRVAYPTLYPYEAWPFIGPFYPFPRVPLGWRSVTLTWQDGHWWYGRTASGHDWWRIRYW